LASGRALGALLVVLGCSGLGAAAVLAKIAYDDGVGVVALLVFRYAAAAAVLVPLAFAHRRRGAEPVQLAPWLALSAVYLASAFTFWAAISYGDVTEVAPIVYLYPTLVALVAAVADGERLGRSGVAGVVCAAAGASLIFGIPSADGSVAAKLLAVLSAVSSAAYYVLAGRLARPGQELQGTAILCVASAAFMVPLLALGGAGLPESSTGWGALVGIAVGGTILGLLFVLFGVVRVGSTYASILTLTEPIVAVALALAVLDETLVGAQLAGVVFVLLAFVLTSVGHPTVRESAPPVPS